ncbi:glycoside hydrolase family 5 protein [Dendrothele bispora CBS 962.96]|uniref:mannan endo-1,4-beta-mannosidase n=1 Tax=Dendrothele bispora (strain CBS 962.96) TaxID=1314807 RepID=A0A4S8KMX8_DENBC|nr:glycoside hydrolase family 5 protein [Dendrothele bispora CBS 962.96]
MRHFSKILIVAVQALILGRTVAAANSFAGANNYYAYGLPDTERHALLDAMKSAGMKVLRTWVSGHTAGQKGSNSAAVNDLEHDGLGTYDDAILKQIDQLMVDAHDRGIKLLIGMYDQNSLLAKDLYGQKFGTSGFYTNPDAIKIFNQRITHILTHKNSLLDNRPWSELGGYIFGYEAQNEPMIFDQNLYQDHLSWICDTAKQIRNNVDDKDQLIFTGGGSAAASVQSAFFDADCAIDVIAIHDYNDDYNNFMSNAVSQAKSAGKKLIVEEWGSAVGSGRVANLQSNIQAINKFKVPWLYWQLITNPDPHEGEDFEIEVKGEDWDTISTGSLQTASLTDAPFDFSASLAL